MGNELKIGISACLLGQQVRYDGGHKRDEFVTDQLSRYATFVPVCPEVEIGLGTPRESLRLVQAPSGNRLVALKSGADHTVEMRAFASRRLKELEGLDLCGYILKKDSPSCGMERVRLYSGEAASRTGRGLFAGALLDRWPALPVEEEGRLHDPSLRENFIERVFAYRRLREFQASRWTIGELVRFHTAEKLLLLAHDTTAYRRLGQVVAAAKGRGRAPVNAEYLDLFMKALAKPATRAKHVNVLQHMEGYFKKVLPVPERRELAVVVDDFRRGLVPLVVPVTLIRHLARRFEVRYLMGQIYLEPHPKELMLRNHA
ncbi:MAG: YbgA family protein [Solirubrobacterales bacterium]